MVVNTILNVSSIVFTISTVLMFGLAVTFKEVVEPLKRYRLLALSLILNLVLIQLIAFGISYFLNLSVALFIGLMLIVIPAGAPIAPRFVNTAEADTKFAVSLLFVLAIASMITVPLTLILLLPPGYSISPLPVVANLLGFVLVPLLIGIGIYTKWKHIAKPLSRIMGIVSTLSLAIVLILTMWAYGPMLLSIVGQFVILASLLCVGVSLGLGYLLGGPGQKTREALMFTSSQRNAAIAFLLFSSFFLFLPEAVLPIMTYTLIQTFLVAGLAIYAGRRRWKAKQSEGEPVTADARTS